MDYIHGYCGLYIWISWIIYMDIVDYIYMDTVDLKWDYYCQFGNNISHSILSGIIAVDLGIFGKCALLIWHKSWYIYLYIYISWFLSQKPTPSSLQSNPTQSKIHFSKIHSRFTHVGSTRQSPYLVRSITSLFCFTIFVINHLLL